jgi:flagellar biosynthesis protein
MSDAPSHPRTSAVALSYRDKGGAPVVVAKGYGAVADSIMRTAREHGLYVHASPELNQLLMRIGLDEQVPPPLYAAVAEVLTWVWQIDRGETPELPINAQ